MKKLILIVSILLFVCTNTVLAQKKKLGDKKETVTTLKASTAGEGAMSVKDDGSNVLMEVNDEGTVGSITLPSGSSAAAPSTNKLYNVNGSLYWNGNQLSTSSSGDFSNGGEAGGADRTLGNTDNYDLGLKTNNLTRLHIQNDGNVGIGTSILGSNYRLTIRSAGTTSSYYGLRVQNSSGSTQFLVRSDGKIGIDTQSPSSKLDIESSSGNDGIDINNTTTIGDPRIRFQLSGTTNFSMGVDDSDSDKLKIGTTSVSTNTRLTIDGSGNIGIGTSSPASKLEVNGTTEMTGFKLTTSPTLNYVLTSDASGNGTWQSATSGSGDFSNGGEAGGADRTLGNTDNYDLGLKTNNLTRLHIQNDGKVGIGTTVPNCNLHVSGNDGVLFTGSGGGTIPVEGDGRRMMWYPDKAAFRVGSVTGTQWNDANIGFLSIAMGSGTTASGYSSFAIGKSTVASGQSAIAMGEYTTASNWGSTAMGVYTTASAYYSTTMGLYTEAAAYASTAIGRYNVGGGNATSWDDTDPLFEIGKGTSDSERINAMTVLKNGNVGIGPSSPGEKLEVDGKIKTTQLQVTTTPTAGHVLTADATGNATWQAASGSGDFSNGGDAGGADRTLGNTDNYDLGFLTNNTNRLHIQNDGNVGIGTTSPAALLDVQGAGSDEGGVSTDNEITAHFKNSRTDEHSAISIDAISGKDAILHIAHNGDSMWDLRNDNSAGNDFQIRYQGGSGSNQTKLTMESDGDVGIGTTSPEGKLHVNGRLELPDNDATPTAGSGAIEIGNQLRIDKNEIITNTGVTLFLQLDNGGDLQVDNGTLLVDASANRVGIGTNTPGTKLAVNGLTGTSSYNNVKVNTSTGDFYYETSSKRYKEDIQNFKTNFHKILEMKPKKYKDNASGQREIGYIAEDFDDTGLNDLVIYNEEKKPNGLKYDRISLYLVEIVKEQQKKISELEERIKNLER